MTDRVIDRFENVEPGEEFWSAEGRLYLRGFEADPEAGLFVETGNLGLRPDHAAGDPMETTEAETEFGETTRRFEADVPTREFEPDELVIRDPEHEPSAERPESRVRFFGSEEG